MSPEATAVFRASDSALVSHQGAHTYIPGQMAIRQLVPFYAFAAFPLFFAWAMLLSTGKGVAQSHSLSPFI